MDREALRLTVADRSGEARRLVRLKEARVSLDVVAGNPVVVEWVVPDSAVEGLVVRRRSLDVARRVDRLRS